ncbi:hypothetical protein [Rhizobium jaguaris]|uniref:Uncharacterized protein n=1 Tax=Rhizobium jaguaris TaxID=1312183 RepID=A0A387FVM6_9HYPH|nr:hypothetical protein [Rhizobium jaguaris]AYG59921.1 hypothetical protein CCGE525_14725 [Rhizobium jaguaris]
MPPDLFINQRHRKEIDDELDEREAAHQKLVARHQALFEATETLTADSNILGSVRWNVTNIRHVVVNRIRDALSAAISARLNIGDVRLLRAG